MDQLERFGFHIHDDDVYTIPQLAEAVGASAKTVDRWTDAREDGCHLRKFRSNGVTLIMGRWVKRFLRGLPAYATPSAARKSRTRRR